MKEYLREFSEEYCDNKKRVAKKERKVLIIRDPIVWSLRKTKERIKKVHYQLPKENKDNFQDMIYPYLTYEFKILKIKKKS